MEEFQSTDRMEPVVIADTVAIRAFMLRNSSRKCCAPTGGPPANYVRSVHAELQVAQELNDIRSALPFKLAKIASMQVGESDARSLEAELLAWAARNGRPAANVSTEFFFLSEKAYSDLQRRLATVLRVA